MQKLPLEPVRAITLDMYGTLLDLDSTFAPGFDQFLKDQKHPANGSDVVDA